MKRLCLLFLCLFSGIRLSAGGVKITDNGRPAATIVLPAEPADTVKFAAEELQLWVKEISGATLPISSDAEVKGTKIVKKVSVLKAGLT